MKLSKRQQEVLDLMIAGWELGKDMSAQGSAWLQKDGLGKGGAIVRVRQNTFYSLCRLALIKVTWERFPIKRYGLTEAGKLLANNDGGER